jgi:hypothetical protein
MMDPYPWDRWEAVLCRSCVCLTEICIWVAVERPLWFIATTMTFTSKNCWVGVGVTLATTSVFATLGGCRLPTIIEFVSVASTEWYTSGYYVRREYGDIASSVPEVWQYLVWRILTEKAIISLGNAPAMGNILVASYVPVLHDGQWRTPTCSAITPCDTDCLTWKKLTTRGVFASQNKVRDRRRTRQLQMAFDYYVNLSRVCLGEFLGVFSRVF